ncbi:heavy metal-associated isoprenylated plant protein 46-like [Triticum dicoccoides]|uniref:heavy metal-associated isoprenylated plant protein 46-like n=1 Tax=Triticum dicoccoides TaxID=85692 RepID=UPI000845005B|nr:heavy metal-associated isoprenylated plant protein 46-like [Triticum dicoccoides]XP_044318438.1 heavy metal-associated isoprenylated plant protein 46-like [Triticum aestivum]
MKQKIVIQLSMSCDKCRSEALTLAARAPGVTSMGITSDARDQLEVVGDGVDLVCLVCCLRKKLGHAQIIKVEEVKKPEEKKKDETKPAMPEPVHPPPYFFYPPSSYYPHQYPLYF